MRARAQDSHGPHTSRERTWDSVAAAAGFLDRFSLSPNLIFAVMGALDKAGYRSAELYTEVTKQKYISNGGQWTSQLALAAKNPQESMPKRQPLPLPEVAALCDKKPPASIGRTRICDQVHTPGFVVALKGNRCQQCKAGAHTNRPS